MCGGGRRDQDVHCVDQRPDPLGRESFWLYGVHQHPAIPHCHKLVCKHFGRNVTADRATLLRCFENLSVRFAIVRISPRDDLRERRLIAPLRKQFGYGMQLRAAFAQGQPIPEERPDVAALPYRLDRKSTRLNSSHT